jgi:hypothetical protein
MRTYFRLTLRLVAVYLVLLAGVLAVAGVLYVVERLLSPSPMVLVG